MCMSSRLYDIGNKLETSLNIFKYICGKSVDILVLNGASSKTKTLTRSTILILCFIQRISSIVIWIDSFSHCGSVYWLSVTSIYDSIFCIHHVTLTIGSYKNFGNTQMSGLTCVFELVNCSKQCRIDFMNVFGSCIDDTYRDINPSFYIYNSVTDKRICKRSIKRKDRLKMVVLK